MKAAEVAMADQILAALAVQQILPMTTDAIAADLELDPGGRVLMVRVMLKLEEMDICHRTILPARVYWQISSRLKTTPEELQLLERLWARSSSAPA